MTEAERFLQEKLNPPKPVVTTTMATPSSPVSGREMNTGWWFLSAPVFSEHRKFWFIGFVLLVFLANFLIAVSSGLPRMLDHRPDDDDMVALCFSMVTSITFWIPALYLLYWSFGRKALKVMGWIASIWMIGVQLYRLGVLFNMRYVETTDIVIGIVVALIGFLGIAAIVRNLIVGSRIRVQSETPVEKRPRPPKTLKVKYACPSCKKTISTSVMVTTNGNTICPSCGNELAVADLARHAKEPIPVQLARAVFYITGILSIMSAIGMFFSGRLYSDFAAMIGQLSVMIGFPVLFFAMAGALKKGKTWVRVLLAILSVLAGTALVLSKCNPVAIVYGVILILPTIFVFLPRSNNWFSLHRFCRKHNK